MTDEPLSVGVLGYRFMGKAHANALARLPMFFPEAPEVEREVVVGRDEEALSEAADRLGFQRYATDWEDVVEEVDVFYNLGPNNIHADPSIAALEAGTHVFCEKPLAHTLEDAERMRDAARESDATAGIAFNYRFIPAIQYAKNLIDAGELGEIHHVRGTYLQDWLVDPDAPWSWRNSKDVAGSGALGDLGAHTIDLSRYLVGDAAGDLTRLSGHLQTFVDERPVPGGDEGSLEGEGGESSETRAVTVDDAYTAQAEFENGAIATYEASRFANGCKNDHSIEINGSKGSLKFSLERLNELELLTEGDRGFQTINVTDPEDPYIDHWWPPGHVIGWEHTFVHENYEFLSAAAAGESHSPSFEDGYRVQELLTAIEESDASGEWVEV
ncbi:Gfo/Idh/MocA family protein [Halosimplex salinum]|uniref:Gfo/Idh/MocA family protein n=1 Tax=Halosimplex salinum TaxID=1710538 RepID=UPI000F4999F9|nr:Gfo/Idh/MocA family oxidoreductase [Halosimplex salinum]